MIFLNVRLAQTENNIYDQHAQIY